LNKSQSGHLLVIYIPTAVADVSPLQIRIEASFTCPDPPICTAGQWFPFSDDIVEAKFVSGSGTNVGAIGVTKANGAFPYYRINSLAGVPGSAAMTVRYSGFPFPIGSASIGPGGEVIINFGTPQQRVITFVIGDDTNVISTGDVLRYPTANFACTINKAMVSGNPSGSITVDIWKRAGAIPTNANKISASAPVTLSASQLNQNSPLTGWTTAVAVGDVFGASVATAATVTSALVQIWCSP